MKPKPGVRAPCLPSKHDEPDMLLPAGKTCGDCVHFKKCEFLLGRIAADAICDWSPSRYRERVTTEPPRFTAEARAYLERLGGHLGMDDDEVLELALRTLYQRYPSLRRRPLSLRMKGH